MRSFLICLASLLVVFGLAALAIIQIDEWIAPGHPLHQHVRRAVPEVFHDETFHHKLLQANSGHDVFFEGWYYKFLGPYSDDIIVVIPGLFQNHVNSSLSEAFITIVYAGRVSYYKYPLTAFRAEPQASGFTIRIGESVFTERSLLLSIVPDGDDDLDHAVGPNAMNEVVTAHVEFENLTPWTQRILHPSTMGMLGWVRGLECYHHVISFHHKLTGYISVGESLTDLTLGTGYLEKDFGVTFPDTWIWAQSNHFTPLTQSSSSDDNGLSTSATASLYTDHVNNHDAPVSLFLSIARAPLPVPTWLLNALGYAEENDRALPGFVAGFLHNKSVHIFATYQCDHITRFEVVNAPHDGTTATNTSTTSKHSKIVYLTYLSYDRTKQLSVQLHTPPAPSTRRKKDTSCKKKKAARSAQSTDDAFSQDDEHSASATAADDNVIVGSSTPATGAPQVAAMYGPKDGRMQKYVKESLIGGRIEVEFEELLTPAEYARRVPPAERKSGVWQQKIVRTQSSITTDNGSGVDSEGDIADTTSADATTIMYARSVYRAIGKPAAMELMGDIDWLRAETERRSVEWSLPTWRWLMYPKNGNSVGIVLLVIALLAALLEATCCRCTRRRRTDDRIRVAPVDEKKKAQ